MLELGVIVFAQASFALVRAAVIMSAMSECSKNAGDAVVSGLAASLGLVEVCFLFFGDENTGAWIAAIQVPVLAECGRVEEKWTSTTCGIGAYLCATTVVINVLISVFLPTPESIIHSTIARARASFDAIGILNVL